MPSCTSFYNVSAKSQYSDLIIDYFIMFAVLQWWRLGWLLARYVVLLLTIIAEH